MTKNGLIGIITDKTGIPRKDVTDVLNAFEDTITLSLRAGEKVTLVGFGSFESKERKAKIGRNPKTGEVIEIPARTVPVFRAGKVLKERIK